MKGIVIRKVDKSVYRKLKQAAVEEDMTIGSAVTEAITHWLETREKKMRPDPHTLLKLNGIVSTGRKGRWSEEIDKILYR